MIFFKSHRYVFQTFEVTFSFALSYLVSDISKDSEFQLSTNCSFTFL